jgi:peptide/nickel transport system permease protein
MRVSQGHSSPEGSHSMDIKPDGEPQVPGAEELLPETKPVSFWGLVWRRLRQDRPAMIGTVICLLLVLTAVLAPWITPHPPDLQYPYPVGTSELGAPLPPNGTFLLGTDKMGRDVLSRVIAGARVSLLVGTVGNGLSVLIGLFLGAIAAFVGGWVEMVIMRFTDVVMSFPTLLLAIALGAVLRPSIGMLIVIIGAVYWGYLARIVHGQVLVLKEMDFVLATRALGGSQWHILWRHILPHLIGPTIVYTTLGVASTVLIEAELSYLGIGVPLGTASWGGMISEAQSYYQTAPWWMLAPGVALMLATLGFNLMGDGLRDAVDPQMHR